MRSNASQHGVYACTLCLQCIGFFFKPNVLVMCLYFVNLRYASFIFQKFEGLLDHERSYLSHEIWFKLGCSAYLGCSLVHPSVAITFHQIPFPSTCLTYFRIMSKLTDLRSSECKRV